MRGKANKLTFGHKVKPVQYKPRGLKRKIYWQAGCFASWLAWRKYNKANRLREQYQSLIDLASRLWSNS